MMKAIRYHENKGGDGFADVLKMETVSVPKAAPGIAVVKVAAVASNPIDFKVLGGYLKDAGWAMPLPFTLGYDFSGTIHEIIDDAEDSSKFPVGKEVFGVQWGQGKHDEDDLPVGGTFAEYVAVPVSRLSVKPSGLSHESAAASSLVGTTAHQIVNKCAKIKKDDKVLVLGGPTAVGMIAVQLANRIGANVYTTASPRNKVFVESLGEGITIINYRANNWWEMDEIKGMDAVIDTTGEDKGWDHAQKVLKPTGGSFVSIASFDVGFGPDGHAPHKFAAFHSFYNDPAVQDEVAKLLAAEEIRIPIVKEPSFDFSVEGAKEMLVAQAKGAHTGKLVMKIG